MLTLFSIPKPFTGQSTLLQRNAIASWRRLHADVEVILFGDETGCAEFAAEIGARHVPDIVRNEFGTPLLNGVFRDAAKCARNQWLCYVNADIVLFDDLIAAVRRISLSPALMIGQRTNLDVSDLIDFSSTSWATDLRSAAASRGIMEDVNGIDYFVFTRDVVPDPFPPFAVGRPGWDNWFVFQTRQRRIPIVDATPSVLAIHQNHGYRHVAGQRGDRWHGPEGDRNLNLMGRRAVYNILDATHALDADGLRPVRGQVYRRRALERLAMRSAAGNWVFQALAHRAPWLFP